MMLIRKGSTNSISNTDIVAQFNSSRKTSLHPTVQTIENGDSQARSSDSFVDMSIIWSLPYNHEFLQNHKRGVTVLIKDGISFEGEILLFFYSSDSKLIAPNWLLYMELEGPVSLVLLFIARLRTSSNVAGWDSPPVGTGQWIDSQASKSSPLTHFWDRFGQLATFIPTHVHTYRHTQAPHNH